MLLGLIFRGIAFEFHFRANTAGGRRAWDVAFLTGSTVATANMPAAGWIGWTLSPRSVAEPW